MNLIAVIITCLITFFSKLNCIIYIFTTSYNRPEFIELQHNCFKKFLSEEYEFIIFNDADDLINKQKIIN